jgi:cardiolipin synthase A/B
LVQLKTTVTSGLGRAACDEAIELIGGGSSPEYLAGLLRGAGRAIRQERERQCVDVVWTGPHSSTTSSRLTSAVVIDLIDGAREEILLVSFAAQPHTALVRALRRAARRGVFLTLLAERADDNPRCNGADQPLTGLISRRFAWPAHRRHQGAALHAKIIVTDRTTALVGSANLTGAALERNLECGVLLRGGRQPAQIHQHVIGLYEREQLVLV